MHILKYYIAVVSHTHYPLRSCLCKSTAKGIVLYTPCCSKWTKILMTGSVSAAQLLNNCLAKNALLHQNLLTS